MGLGWPGPPCPSKIPWFLSFSAHLPLFFLLGPPKTVLFWCGSGVLKQLAWFKDHFKFEPIQRVIEQLLCHEYCFTIAKSYKDFGKKWYFLKSLVYIRTAQTCRTTYLKSLDFCTSRFIWNSSYQIAFQQYRMIFLGCKNILTIQGIDWCAIRYSKCIKILYIV